MNINNFSYESKQPFILDQNLIIKPDYSNLSHKVGSVETTGDWFGILINAGAKLTINEGGDIGNINIVLEEGDINIPCNPDIIFPYVKRPSSTPNTNQSTVLLNY